MRESVTDSLGLGGAARANPRPRKQITDTVSVGVRVVPQPGSLLTVEESQVKQVVYTEKTSLLKSR